MYYAGKNRLKILVDPLSIHLDASLELSNNQVNITTVLDYLRQIGENKVGIEFIFPEFLWDGAWRENPDAFIPGDYPNMLPTTIKEREELPVWVKDKSVKIRSYFEKKREEYLKVPKLDLKDSQLLIEKLLDYRDANSLYNKGYLDLIDLYYQYDCDFLLTSNRTLLREKTWLKRNRIFATYYPEFIDELEVFLKGHGIYISSRLPIYGLGVSTFYSMTDPRFNKFFKFWNKLNELKKSVEMSEYLRVMIFHRYNFILYSIDQIKFHLQQAERLEDDNLRSNHYYLISYHLNSFYLNLWGYLDNLAWVFNYLYDMGFDSKTAIKVSFSSKDYKKKLKIYAPQIYSLLGEKEIKTWIEVLAKKRHPAAHREPLFLSPMYDKNTMNLISEQMVVVNTPNGREGFEAVNTLDADYKELDKFITRIYNLYIQNQD